MFVSLKEVSFSYGIRKAINNISFEVEKGSVVAIVGSSGSGKSTILRLVAGLLQQDQTTSSKITVDNQTPLQYQRQGKLALMFQQPNLFPNLTVQENISLPLEISAQQDSELVRQMIRTVGLSECSSLLPRQLSGGMATRVALARAFITRPELLLLDEPFSSLDIAWKDALYQELKELISQHKTTVMLVTHDIEEAVLLADKVICLGINGEIIKEFENTRTVELQTAIKDLVIQDHRLRKEYEKVSNISSN